VQPRTVDDHGHASDVPTAPAAEAVTVRLSLSWGTVSAAPIDEHIRAAAASGYSGLMISPEQYAAMEMTPTELRSRLDDNGLAADAIDPALVWLPGLEPRPGAGVMAFDVSELLDAAAAIGARWINASAGMLGPWSEGEVIDAFAALCERGRQVGVGVLLEFLPWSVVRDLPTAARVVRSAGAADAGITLDLWHFHRGGGRLADLTAEDLALVHCIQVSDAHEIPTADVMIEAMTDRILPGEGAIPLRQLLPRILEHAATKDLSVEVFSTALAMQGPAEVARAAAAATRWVLDEPD
jgi:sugar phosphate isomerase/epimerase